MAAESPQTAPGPLSAGVTLTFDLDVESPLLAQSARFRSRLTSLSEARYALRRSVPRLLDLLRSNEIAATFYVPGAVAQSYPETLGAIIEAGHEIAHHGHDHLRSDRISAGREREEIERGLDALERLGGGRPRGYRSPSWELTPETARLLAEYGFEFDSSLMEDDRPYALQIGEAELIELPCHWSLDDWVYFGWQGATGGAMSEPKAFLATWLDEYRSATDEARHLTYTMHPEIIGRGYRVTALARLVEAIREGGSIFTTHGRVAADAALDRGGLGDPVRLEV